MALRIGSGCSLVFILFQLGCASSAEARPAAKTPGDAKANPAAMPAEPSRSDAAQVAVSSSVSATAATDGPPPPPAPDPRTGEMPRGLPELKVRLSGLHIGGGPNDAVTKQPFIETLERGFASMRACYSQVEQPDKGGTFGVDLRVDRQGGHPTLQAVRTVMKGDDFKACVQSAFQALDFAPPAKGPTVLSASVRFSLEP